jgi:hypothetical protein
LDQVFLGAAEPSGSSGPPWYVLVLAGVIATALLTFLVRLFLDRRAERARVKGPARIVRAELDSGIEALVDCLDTGHWTPREPLALPTWESEKTTLGAALTREELLVMRTAERWIRDVNDVGRSRKSELNADRLARVSAALHALQLALRAIEPVAEGRGGLLTTRRTPEAVGPDPFARCICGHPFTDHESRIRRRLLRTTQLRASHVEVAKDCLACECTRFFAGDADGVSPRLLRRMRLAPQASYETRNSDRLDAEYLQDT